MKRLTIGALAKQGGVNLETVRYYERVGLLPKPARTPAGYRVYSGETGFRLRFIRRAKELGFSLEEIRGLLAFKVSPGTTRAEVRKRAQEKIAAIETKIKTLQAMRNALRQLTRGCVGCGPASECRILDSLEKGDA